MDWKSFKNINFSEIFGKIINGLILKVRWIFLGVAVILTAVCCYFWYFYLYHSEWSETRKQTYIQTKEAVIAFDRGKFDKFIQGVDDRQAEFQKDLSITTDIFRVKK